MNRILSGPVLLAAVFALLFSSLMTGGCEKQKEENSEGKNPVVGVLLYRDNDIYISMVYRELARALEGQADVIMLAAKEDQLIQDDQIDRLIAAGVDAIAINLVDTQTAASVIDLAKKSNIPIVFFNREPDLQMLKIHGKAAFIGTNTVEAGKMQGEIIARLWREHPEFDRNKDGRLQYVMLQGNSDNPEAMARTEFSIRRARELGVNMQQTGQSYVCNWDKDLAREAMHVAFGLHEKEIEFIVSNNDDMALGAIEALNEYGFNLPGDKTKFIPIIGVDAIPPAIKAIEQGTLSATVKQDSEAMGQAIASLVMNIIAGKDFLDGTAYKWDESGVAIRIPYATLSSDEGML